MQACAAPVNPAPREPKQTTEGADAAAEPARCLLDCLGASPAAPVARAAAAASGFIHAW